MQRINLASALPKPPRQFLTAARFESIVIIAIAALFLIYFLQGGYIFIQEKRSEWITSDIAKANQKLADVKIKYANTSMDDKLRAQITQLQQEINQKNAILSTIDSQTSINQMTFINYLNGFANDITQGAWLTHIQLNQTPDKINLTGSALTSQPVVTFFHQLVKDNTFSDKDFSVFKIYASGAPSNAAQQAGSIDNGSVTFNLGTGNESTVVTP